MESKAALARISSLLKAKRREAGLGLREAAKETGVSPSTLSRLERFSSSALPDSETLTKLSKWLGMSVEYMLYGQNSEAKKEDIKLSTPELVEVHLRADKKLSPDTAKALSEMFKILYNQFSNAGNNNSASKSQTNG
jgi:transcriptional regulator with XRE-family HTH domain